jgi:hypothetical protein
MDDRSGDRRDVLLRIFFGLAVVTISSALFRHVVVFLQEHFAPPALRNAGHTWRLVHRVTGKREKISQGRGVPLY